MVSDGYTVGAGYSLDSSMYGSFSAAEHIQFSSPQTGTIASFATCPSGTGVIAAAFKGTAGGGGGGTAWTNPSNLADPDNFATLTSVAHGLTSQADQGTGFGFA